MGEEHAGRKQPSKPIDLDKIPEDKSNQTQKAIDEWQDAKAEQARLLLWQQQLPAEYGRRGKAAFEIINAFQYQSYRDNARLSLSAYTVDTNIGLRLRLDSCCPMWRPGQWYLDETIDYAVQIHQASIGFVPQTQHRYERCADLFTWLGINTVDERVKHLRQCIDHAQKTRTLDSDGQYRFERPSSGSGFTYSSNFPLATMDITNSVHFAYNAGQHWVAVEARKTGGEHGTIYLTNSKSGINVYPQAAKELPALLELASLRPGSTFNGIQKWTIKSVRTVQQSNSDDCGPFTVHNIIRSMSDNVAYSSILQTLSFHESALDRGLHYLVLDTVAVWSTIGEDMRAGAPLDAFGDVNDYDLDDQESKVNVQDSVINGREDHKSTSDHNATPFFTWIHNSLEEFGPLKAFEVIAAISRYTDLIIEDEGEMLIRMILDQERMFDYDPTTTAYSIREGHSVSHSNVAQLVHDLAGHSSFTRYDPGEDFALVISCSRCSGGFLKHETAATALEIPRHLVEKWCSEFDISFDTLSEIKRADDLLSSQRFWLSFALDPQSSSTPLFCGTGALISTARQLLQAINSSDWTGSKTVLILQAGFDGSSTDPSSLYNYSREYSSISFRTIIAIWQKKLEHIPAPWDKPFEPSQVTPLAWTCLSWPTAYVDPMLLDVEDEANLSSRYLTTVFSFANIYKILCSLVHKRGHSHQWTFSEVSRLSVQLLTKACRNSMHLDNPPSVLDNVISPSVLEERIQTKRKIERDATPGLNTKTKLPTSGRLSCSICPARFLSEKHLW